ncbi:Gag-Pol polyprotein [Gossypium australe]|uniref:Gag-Pol polyprotein n=1 Tax=Gossypium australe TaxID=47621 RepID=A0A5B6X2B5_9ROSI|nr:Gag-Pol polyprotein [Gossypium australe]
MFVTEYEREIVRLSQYARECVSTEAIMCKRFEDRLNEDIRLLVGILELKEFVVLVDRECKVEELGKEKRKVNFEARDSRKRSISNPYHSSSKKLWDSYNRSTALVGYSNRDHGKKYTSPKARATLVSSVGSERNNKHECQQCGRRNFGDCWMNNKGCFKCGLQDHYIRDYPELPEKDRYQNARPSNTAAKGKLPKNTGNVTSSKGTKKDSAVRFEARAPARAYAIHARKDVSSLDVITGTFFLYDTNSLLVESTEFVIKVSNPLGKYVLIDKVCKNFPLVTRGYYFAANLMLLPFDEFDVILGMDKLTLRHVVVNCRRKTIELKCQNSEILRIESDKSSELHIRKGCDAYLAYVLDTKVSESKIQLVPVVYEYPDVFPEELSGCPPIREVKFAIKLVLRTSPILIAPYRMTST